MHPGGKCRCGGVIGLIDQNLKSYYQFINQTFMSKRFMMVLLAFLTIGWQAFAQNVVTGKVTDAQGEALVGASVQIKGTLTGVVTDLDGNFSIKAGSGATLVVNSIGYKTAEIAVSGRDNLGVVLEEDTLFLDDVVVLGYNTSARKKDLTGSITQISNKLIENQNTSSVSKILEGAVAGLNIASIDGQPGVDSGIRIRGVGSTQVNSSGALIVIDGVAMSPDLSNVLSQLNPQDIASVTVLKDAASTAVYGSKGANGVVLITTKSGNSGRAKISFTAKLGVVTTAGFDVGAIDSAAGQYEFMWKSIYNSYRYGVDGKGLPKFDAGTGSYYTNANTPNHTHEEAAVFASKHLFNYIGSETTFGLNALGNNMAYYVPGARYVKDLGGISSSMYDAYLIDPATGKINPNARLLYDETWADYLLSPKLRQEYSVSANGGNTKTTYYMSLNYFNDKSPLPSSAYNRISGRAKVDTWVTEWLKVGANVSLAKTKTNFQPSNTWQARNAGSSVANYIRFIAQAPIVSVYARDLQGNLKFYDGKPEVNRNATYHSDSPLGPTAGGGGNSSPGYTTVDPIYMSEVDLRQHQTTTLNTRAYMEIPFLQHFKFRTDLAYDLVANMETRYLNGTANSRVSANKGGFMRTSTTTNVINLQSQLLYNQDFNKHHVDAQLLFENDDYQSDWVRYASTYELIPGFISSGNFVGKSVSVSGMSGNGTGTDIVRLRSYLGRANYVYADKYCLSGSIRRDGSSKFRYKENRWGTFWSVGAGWRFSNEAFLDGADWLTNGKVRASYGVIGNQNGVGKYSGYTTWSYSGKYPSATNGTGSPNGYSLTMGALVNDSLTWENTHTFDTGIDLTLFDRVDITFDWYNRLTVNSFFDQPVSKAATGQTKLSQNCAGIQNRGFEFDINADIIRNKDWRWNVGLNLTHYRTILKSLPDDIKATTGKADWYLPDGTWTANGDVWSGSTGTYGAGSSSDFFYLRGEGRDWYNVYIHRYMGPDEYGLPTYLHRVTPEEEKAGTYPGKKAGEGVVTNDYAKSDFWEVGSAIPAVIGGFNTSLTWKNWTLSANFAFQLGGKFYSHEYVQNLYNYENVNRSQRLVSKELVGNTWTPENKGAKFPMQWYDASGAAFFTGTSANGTNWKFTDIALFSASYLRLKNVTLGYTVPQKALQRVGLGIISGLRVFASGDNVFILAAHKGIDPSLSATGGHEIGPYVYPNIQSFTFGVNVDF